MTNRAIGVFDSGIGGLSVLQALRVKLPQENFIYIADSGHSPYGERDETHVLARSRAIVNHLVGQNVKALVIACNTATAVAIHLLREEYPKLPLIGVEPALKPAVALSKTGHIGVMATRSTLGSAKFQALLNSMTARASFVVQACDGLADAIEHSVETEDTTKIIALCTQYAGAMGLLGNNSDQIDCLVLGCTHYPFASGHLRTLLGQGVQIVDNGEAVARQTQRLIQTLQVEAHHALLAAPGSVSLFSTGQTHTLQAAARRWLNLTVPVGPLCF